MNTRTLSVAAVGDAVTLAALHAQVAPGRRDRAWGAEEYARLLATPGHCALLAGDVGFILFRQIGDDCEILMTAVQPTAQRRGIGGALLDAALAHALAAQAHRVLLEVAVDNAAAIGLYRSRGFADIAHRRGYYTRASGATVDACVMARAIAPVEAAIPLDHRTGADSAMTPASASSYSRTAED